MKWLPFRRNCAAAMVRKRRSMSFEQLENRNLLSADVWHASNVFPQPTVAAVVDDAFENNDSFNQAADLGSLSQSAALNDLVIADQADWFKFQMPHAADSTSRVSIEFLHAQGDLDLAIYDANARLVGYSNSTNNRETVSLAGMNAGTYYAYVYGYRGATNSHYTLTVNPGQIKVDDRFEPNNSFAAAANLGTFSIARTEQNLVMADAGDWYKFTINAAGASTSYVGISFQNTSGDLDIELFDSSGRRLGISQGVTDSETIALAGLAAGSYTIHVYGYHGASNPSYTLTIAPGSTSASNPTNMPVSPPTITPTQPTNPAVSGFQIDLQISGLTVAQQAIFQQAAALWSQVIVGDLPNMTYNGQSVDDLLINVSATSIDGTGGVLGQAGPDRFRSGSQLPYHGSMQFDSADLAQMQSNGTLLGVVMHEIGHVLGIGTIWQNLGLLAGTGSNNPTFIGPQATAAYNAAFGTHAIGVPVENTGGPGTRDGHWRESIFGSELMTGFIGPGLSLPLSRMTIASLADLGYQVNFAAAT